MPSPDPVPVQVRSPVRSGQIVDRKYKVDAVLGAGGMGIVVSAMHLALEEPVALKFMTIGEGKGDATSRTRFLREAKAARKLTSAHVARVYDVGQLPSGEPYIVMELLRGDDLARHLRARGRLSPGETVRYMLEVCDAIREAHALGIIHRDLKPQNLFLAERAGSSPIIKVLDFGIAKSLETTKTDGSLTASQGVIGSPLYMSPEQLRAAKSVDERTDIWSIGVIMFELLSGKVPFAGDSVLELGMRIMTVPAPSLVELRNEIPAALADVVQRCLEKEPDRRFATVDALAHALKPFADTSTRSLPFADTLDEPSLSLPPDHPDRVPTGGEFAGTKEGMTTRTNRSALTWAAVAVLPIVVLGVALLRRHEVPVTSAPPPQAPTPLTYHVDLRVDPRSARVRLDTEPPVSSPFATDLARDGKPHTLAVEADGFEPLELSFRDVPPPADVTLKPLAASSTPPNPSAAATPNPPSLRVTPRREGATKPEPRSTPSAAPSASSPPATPPTTANDSPIVR